MSLDKVSSAQPVVLVAQPEKKSSGIVAGTITTAAVGAGVMSGLNYVGQRQIIKNPDVFVNQVKENTNTFIKTVRKNLGNTKEAKEAIINCGKAAFAQMRMIRDFAKKGVVDYKMLGKAAGIGAIVTGGAFLVYRGIKALFTSKS